MEHQRPIIERQPPVLPNDTETLRTVLAMLVEAGAFLPVARADHSVVGSDPADCPLHAIYQRLVEEGYWPAYGTRTDEQPQQEEHKQQPTAEADRGFSTTVPA